MYNIIDDQANDQQHKPAILISNRKFAQLSECRFKANLSYWKTPGSEPLKSLTVTDLVDSAADKYESRDAVVSKHQGTKLSFRQIREHSRNLACGLLAIGLKKGDHIGLLGPNTLQWYLSLLGAIEAGLIVVNLNPLLEPPEIKFCLKKADVKALIVDESFVQREYYPILCRVIPHLSQMQSGRPITGNSDVPLLSRIIIMSDKLYPGTYRWDDVLNSGNVSATTELNRIRQQMNVHDACNVQFTSGTTGSPKGALLSHHNIVNNSYFFGKRLLLAEKHHKICFQVPLFHTFGTVLGVLAALHNGTTLVMPSFKFSPTKSIEAIISEKCSVIYGTPTMYIDLINIVNKMIDNNIMKLSDLSSLEVALAAGSVCPPELFKKLKKMFNFKRIYSGYGMTESSPITFLSLPTDSDFQITSTVGYVADHAEMATTVGYVAEHVEIKVVNEDGVTVPIGMPGEVLFKGYMVMKGYYNDSDATKTAVKDGWLHSGDRFVLLENGYGQVIGRKKDTIIRGGENIEPSEIENVVLSHPEIANIQVYGVYDERLGEVVAASIIKKPASSLTEEDVRNHCKGNIATYKIPEYIEFVTEYPQTASGKVQKFKLRELLEENLQLRKTTTSSIISMR